MALLIRGYAETKPIILLTAPPHSLHLNASYNTYKKEVGSKFHDMVLSKKSKGKKNIDCKILFRSED